MAMTDHEPSLREIITTCELELKTIGWRLDAIAAESRGLELRAAHGDVEARTKLDCFAAERKSLRERASFIADRSADASLNLKILEQAAADFEAEAKGAGTWE